MGLSGTPDQEKVLKGLQCCVDPLIKAGCLECPYYPCYDKDTTSDKLLADALALLQEREPVKPIEMINDFYPIGDSLRTEGWKCGKCGQRIAWNDNYCSKCGRAVNWNA